MARKKWVPKSGRHQTGPGTSADCKDVAPWNGSGFRANFQLEDVDGRTRVGKSILAIKKHLREYIGNNTVVTEILISQICYKTVRLSMYTHACLKDARQMESQYYMPMANSLRSDLQALAGLVGESRPPDLNDYLNMKDVKGGEADNEQKGK